MSDDAKTMRAKLRCEIARELLVKRCNGDPLAAIAAGYSTAEQLAQAAVRVASAMVNELDAAAAALTDTRPIGTWAARELTRLISENESDVEAWMASLYPSTVMPSREMAIGILRGDYKSAACRDTRCSIVAVHPAHTWPTDRAGQEAASEGAELRDLSR